ncbi:MAG TPA: protein translocase subunit SecF [Pyrinomonadaceae bacterium]|nr:protein translocase subunit SecF [Pyrinomonadaceae bacterium]
MFQIFKAVNFDWLKWRRIFIGISVLLMVAGLGSAIFREWKHPNGTNAFNLGVDFRGGTVVTARFKQAATAEQIRATLGAQGLNEAVIQPVVDRPDTFLIKLPLAGAGSTESDSDVELGRTKVRTALNSIGPEGSAYEIIGTDAVGAVAGAELRNKAIAVTLAALVGMLVYIAFRFEWTYGAAAVIAVFHDVLVTLGFFSIFQWEVNLTVIAAFLTLVGASVNDTIVVFDRVRENRKLHRRESLYKITNDSINQTLSRTVITQGLIVLSVLAMVIFGGEVLRAFSLALLIGTIVGTYSSIAIASPIMVWWERKIEAANKLATTASARSGFQPKRTDAGRKNVGKPSRAA